MCSCFIEFIRVVEMRSNVRPAEKNQTSVVCVCAFCPNLFGRQLVFKILEHLQ